MKTRITPRVRASAGHALLIVLCIVAATLTVLAATMNRTIGTASNNARNNQYVAGLYAAEAATEKVFGMMKSDFLACNLTGITNHLSLYQGAIPTSTEDPYWGQYQFSDGAGHANSNYVACMLTSYQMKTNWGPLATQYAGLCGWINKYRIVSNVKQTLGTTYNITSTCQQEIELDLIPIFQFAIFYNSLLEFTWCAPFTVNGRTHANGSIYTGSIQPLKFNALVTTTGSISSPAWFGKTTDQYTDKGTFNGGYSTNWLALTLPIGTNNTPDAVRQIINMPPAGEDVNSALGQQRYYNKADIVLLVSNSTVTVNLKTSPSDPGTNISANYYATNSYASNYVQIATNFPFLNVTNFFGTGGVSTNYFTDQREGDSVKVTDIDMGILKSWLVTNAVVQGKFSNTGGLYSLSNVPNILYAADNRTYTASQLTAIRLKNAQIIPTNMVTIAGNNQPSGFTVATPNPLYVWGNYNCPNNADLGTTSTLATYPASLVSDALTILSTNWTDKHSNDSFSTGVRVATSTTVNAAILTGVVYSTGASDTQFSGGVHNLPRLLEDWGNGSASVVLTLNTSVVNFFNSVQATSQFRAPGIYYYAPTRQFSFDLNFLDYTKQPPGTPMLCTALRSKWTTPPPNTTTYAGN
jgi:hypothetical protein